MASTADHTSVSCPPKSSSTAPTVCHTPELASSISFPKNSVKLPTDWALSERDCCDLELLLNGGFAPLNGYLCRADYLSVLNNMRLTTGQVWPMPIVLAIPKTATKPNLHWTEGKGEEQTTGTDGDRIRLRDKLGTVVAELIVQDVYEPDLELEKLKVLGTTDPNHPYVHYLETHHKGCYYIGGDVVSKAPILHFDFEAFRKSASCVRAMLKEQGHEVVVGFQTRNPMHCSHFELTRQAIKEAEAIEGKPAHLLLSPAVGPTQPGDIEYSIRVRCYKKLLSHYPKGSVDMVLLPLAMRMAGPREAVWHAIIRKNYGCTHFIVGRDHAGPSTRTKDGKPFYGEYEAHELLKSVQGEMGIKPIFGKAMVYVGEEHGGYVQADAVPEGAEALNISGTDLRKKLQAREHIPEWFSFPSVVEELLKFYKPLPDRGLCVYFTGLPCSGKSTLANAVQASLLENENEDRRVTTFDADVIRTHLSKGLGFSKDDRSCNVRRIGYVASEVVKHHGICLVANIAPYEDDRKFNRELITSEGGGYVEVYVSTPIDVCETRDVKELYKKARLGIVQQFTGVSDPYEEPRDAELTVDSSDDVHGKVKLVMDYLKEKHLIK
eukprot:GHVS01016162.1.p1 GENE.GHVS01016162.1~~GHVS01016162.1.p1  ORF type:complete len:607 (+),score=81.05 GHVS01016162.1:352-2172(+)